MNYEEMKEYAEIALVMLLIISSIAAFGYALIVAFASGNLTLGFGMLIVGAIVGVIWTGCMEDACRERP